MSFEEMNPLHSNGVHVMLVDYDPTSLSKSTSVLRQASFKVTPTKVQQMALTLLQEHKGEINMLIASDQNQEMDCHSFIQRIRIIQEDLPIIVISSLEADQGLKTLFDGGCYVIGKPVTESFIWGVWQQHQMRANPVTGRQVHRGNGEQVTEGSRVSGGNGSVGQAEYAPHDPKGKALERDENRKLKRNKPCEDEEQEVARKKGKSIAEPSKMDEKKTSTKGLRPKFDPQQHKILMEALSYVPTRHMNTAQFIPTVGRQQVPTIAERHRRARAPWTQYLNERFEKAMARNNIPGYGVQQPNIYQMMMSKRFPPSWMSPTNWRGRLNSEYLNRRTDETIGGVPMSGLTDRYRASTSINGGLNVGEYQMPMNPNMVHFNGLGSSMANGMDQNMNPKMVDFNGLGSSMANGMDQNMNPKMVDFHGLGTSMVNGMDQNMNPKMVDFNGLGTSMVNGMDQNMNPKMVDFNGLGSSMVNGMDQNMNPKMVDLNGLGSSMVNGMDQNMKSKMVDFNGLGSSMANGMDQNMNQVRTQPNAILLDGYNNGARDGMGFGSYGYDNSLLSDVYPVKGNTQMEKQVNESIGYGQSFASRFGYPVTDLGSFPGVEGNFFQSTNYVLSADLQTAAHNAAEVEVEENVNEENVVTWQALGRTPTNQVETLVKPSKQGSEGEDRAEILNSDVDEFAEIISFLENDADDGRTNSSANKADKVEGDSYFDIERFGLRCGDRQI